MPLGTVISAISPIDFPKSPLPIGDVDEILLEAYAKQIPQIQKLVKVIVENMKLGGRLFYIGARN